MFHRTALTAIVLTYLICVLILNGVQKEDLDINTLTKLKQHNFDLDDLNNETVHKKCLELQASKMVDSIVSKLETVEDKRNSFTSISPVESNIFSDEPTVTSQKPLKENKHKLNSENEKNLRDHNKKIVENGTLAPATNNYESSTEKTTQSTKLPLSIWEILQSLQKNKETQQDIYNYKAREIITTTTQLAPKKSQIFITDNKSDMIKKMEGLSRLLLQEFMSENNKPTVTTSRTGIETLKQINDYFATESGVTSNFEPTKRTDDVGSIIDDRFKNNKFKDLLSYVNTAISIPSNENVDKTIINDGLKNNKFKDLSNFEPTKRTGDVGAIIDDRFKNNKFKDLLSYLNKAISIPSNENVDKIIINDGLKNNKFKDLLSYVNTAIAIPSNVDKTIINDKFKNNKFKDLSNFEPTKRTDDVGAIIDDRFKSNKFKDLLSYVNTPMSIPSNENVDKTIIINDELKTNKFKDLLSYLNTAISIPSNENVDKTIINDVLKNNEFKDLLSYLNTAISIPSNENVGKTIINDGLKNNKFKDLLSYVNRAISIPSNENVDKTIISDGYKNNKFKDLLSYVNTAISIPSNEKVDKGKKCCIVNNNLYSINGVKHVNNEDKENNTNIIPKNIVKEITEQIRKTIMKDVMKELSNTRKIELRTTAATTPAPEKVSNDTIVKITRTVIDSMLKDAIQESPQRIDKNKVPSLENIMLNTSKTNADKIPQTYILPHVSRLTQLVLPYSFKKNSFINFYENTHPKLGPIYTQKSELNTQNETPNDEKFYDNMSKNLERYFFKYPVENFPDISVPEAKERYFLKYPVENLPDISFPEANNRQVNNINVDIPSSTTTSPKNINQNSNNTRVNREQFMKRNYPYNMPPGPNFMPVEIKSNNSFPDLSLQIQSLKEVNQSELTPIPINPYDIGNAYNIYRNSAQKTDVMKNCPKVKIYSTSTTTTTTTKPETTTKISETSKVLDQLKVLFKELDSIKREIAPKKEHYKESDKNNNIHHSHAKSREDTELNIRNPYILSQKKISGVAKPKYIPAKTIQTNRDSIPPLGIPLTVKKNPFSVLIVNQNIIVTSTRKPHYYEPRKPEVNVRADRRNDYRQSNNMYNDYYDDVDNQEPYYDVTRKPPQLVAQNTRLQTRNKNYKADSFSYNEYSVPLQPYPQRPNPPWNDEKFALPIRGPESNLDNYPPEHSRKFNPREKIETYDFKRKKYVDDDIESSGRTNQQEMESTKQQGKVENPQYNEDRPQERAVEQREGNAFQKLPEVRLEKDRKLMGVDTDASSPTANKVPQRQQLPLKKRVPKYDTHFKDFMKSQQKVNAMLEKILATRIPSALIL